MRLVRQIDYYQYPAMCTVPFIRFVLCKCELCSLISNLLVRDHTGTTNSTLCSLRGIDLSLLFLRFDVIRDTIRDIVYILKHYYEMA